MSSSRKALVVVEVGDQVHTGIRINSIRDQLQWSKSARANGWDRTDDLLATIFMAWFAGKTQGLWDLSWDDFSTRDDVYVTEDEEPEQDGPEAIDDPSQPETPDAP